MSPSVSAAASTPPPSVLRMIVELWVSLRLFRRVPLYPAALMHPLALLERVLLLILLVVLPPQLLVVVPLFALK